MPDGAHVMCARGGCPTGDAGAPGKEGTSVPMEGGYRLVCRMNKVPGVLETGHGVCQVIGAQVCRINMAWSVPRGARRGCAECRPPRVPTEEPAGVPGRGKRECAG